MKCDNAHWHSTTTSVRVELLDSRVVGTNIVTNANKLEHIVHFSVGSSLFLGSAKHTSRTESVCRPSFLVKFCRLSFQLQSQVTAVAVKTSLFIHR